MDSPCRRGACPVHRHGARFGRFTGVPYCAAFPDHSDIVFRVCRAEEARVGLAVLAIESGRVEHARAGVPTRAVACSAARSAGRSDIPARRLGSSTILEVLGWEAPRSARRGARLLTPVSRRARSPASASPISGATVFGSTPVFRCTTRSCGRTVARPLVATGSARTVCLM